MSSLGSQRTPSSGMQYTQRKLQRSVTLMRSTRTAAIDCGPVSSAAVFAKTGRRMRGILRGAYVIGNVLQRLHVGAAILSDVRVDRSKAMCYITWRGATNAAGEQQSNQRSFQYET